MLPFDHETVARRGRFGARCDRAVMTVPRFARAWPAACWHCYQPWRGPFLFSNHDLPRRQRDRIADLLAPRSVRCGIWSPVGAASAHTSGGSSLNADERDDACHSSCFLAGVIELDQCLIGRPRALCV